MIFTAWPISASVGPSTVTFKIGTDLNFAQVLVQNRVSSALSQLPQAVQNQGVTVQKRSTSILLFVTLTSPDSRYDSLYLSNYATINIRDELSRLPGVGNVFTRVADEVVARSAGDGAGELVLRLRFVPA